MANDSVNLYHSPGAKGASHLVNMWSETSLFVVSFITGITVHLCYFRRGEHHLYPLRCLQLHLGAVLLAGALLQYGTDRAAFNAWITTTLLGIAYLVGLYSSLLVYRGFLHPLRGFPGPFGARFSAFWMSWQLVDKPAFQKLQELHERYGPIVRVGPSDLSIALPRAVSAVHGPKSPCTKNSFYDMTAPVRSLHSHRTRAVHDRRRRVWSPAFSDRALRGYETRIRVHRQKLFQALAAHANEKINISDWFNFYSYDVMGDLAFAKSFHMLETESNHWALKALIDGFFPLELLLPMWVFRLLMAIPGLAKDFWQFAEFCKQRLTDRMQREPDIPDISASLLAPVGKRKPSPEEMNQLMGDTQLIITAGRYSSGGMQFKIHGLC